MVSWGTWCPGVLVSAKQTTQRLTVNIWDGFYLREQTWLQLWFQINLLDPPHVLSSLFTSVIYMLPVQISQRFERISETSLSQLLALVLLVEAGSRGSLPACPGWILGFVFQECCLLLFLTLCL